MASIRPRLGGRGLASRARGICAIGSIGPDAGQAHSEGGCPGKLLSPARRRGCIEQVRAQLHVFERRATVSRLLQIDGLVATVLVELGAPDLVRALMLGWPEADGRSQSHVEITHRF